MLTKNAKPTSIFVKTVHFRSKTRNLGVESHPNASQFISFTFVMERFDELSSESAILFILTYPTQNQLIVSEEVPRLPTLL